MRGAFLILCILFVGCQGNERLSEKASIEGKASADAQIAAENENQAKRSAEMESDLALRHNFYQAVKGTYEGGMVLEEAETTGKPDDQKEEFKIRLLLVPSLPRYNAKRVRRLEEIASDLNTLSLNVQIIQWNPKNKLSAVGCRIENVRPDIVSGEINIASANCPNAFRLRLADTANLRNSETVALDAKDGRISSVSDLEGEVLPSTNAAVYKLSAKRVRN
ncbi:MAG: hypothetical protein AB7F43_12330 [Bacteriovoracia bacterium]